MGGVRPRDRPGPLRHVGSVTAPDASAAYERAAALFGRDAVDVWLCPADAVTRYAARSLATGEDGR